MVARGRGPEGGRYGFFRGRSILCANTRGRDGQVGEKETFDEGAARKAAEQDKGRQERAAGGGGGATEQAAKHDTVKNTIQNMR